MNKNSLKPDNAKDGSIKMVEIYYKKAMRIIEFYVLICFILITFVPLLNYSWVPGFTKFIYLTGFPLLILVFTVSLIKEPFLKLLSNIFEK